MEVWGGLAWDSLLHDVNPSQFPDKTGGQKLRIVTSVLAVCKSGFSDSYPVPQPSTSSPLSTRVKNSPMIGLLLTTPTPTRRSSVEFSSVAELCPTLCDPMNCSPPGFSVHGILQARILEWIAIPFSENLPNPGIEPWFPLSIWTWVQPLGWEDLLEKGKAAHSSILAWSCQSEARLSHLHSLSLNHYSDSISNYWL